MCYQHCIVLRVSQRNQEYWESTSFPSRATLIGHIKSQPTLNTLSEAHETEKTLASFLGHPTHLSIVQGREPKVFTYQHSR